MKKRIISMLMAIIMIVSTLAVTAYAEPTRGALQSSTDRGWNMEFWNGGSVEWKTFTWIDASGRYRSATMNGIITLYMDDQIVYDISPDVPYRGEESSNTPVSWSTDLTSKQRSAINAAIVLSSEINVPEGTDPDSLMPYKFIKDCAVQTIIYELIVGNRNPATGECMYPLYTFRASLKYYWSVYAQLEELIQDLFCTPYPSFYNDSPIMMDRTSDGQSCEAYLVDSNNVIKYFTAECEDSNITTRIEGNVLSINAENSESIKDAKIKLIRRFPEASEQCGYIFSRNENAGYGGQLMTVGSLDPLMFELTLDVNLPVTKAALVEAMIAVRKLQQELYTESSWERLQEQVGYSWQIIEKSDAKQDEVDAQTATLINARKMLEYVTDKNFTDVPKNSTIYYADPVYWAATREPVITKGISDDVFGVNNKCTRGQVVTFLWRAAGEPAPVSAENPFSDVDRSAYFYKAVLWAVENGITKGTSDTEFSPNDTCTRAQVVTFLWRVAGEPECNIQPPFEDIYSSTLRATKTYYFTEAVSWAYANEITKGTSATKFSPNANCTRGQIVTFIYNYYTTAQN